MSGFGALPSPLRLAGISVGIFNQVEHILHVSGHFVHRNASLLAVAAKFILGMMAARAGILARNAGRNHGYRFGTDILAELEILKVSQSACLMISPQIAQRLAGLQRTDGALPVVDVVNAVAMGHTAAGETHKTRMQVGQRLGQVGTKSVLTSLERLLREE